MGKSFPNYTLGFHIILIPLTPIRDFVKKKKKKKSPIRDSHSHLDQKFSFYIILVPLTPIRYFIIIFFKRNPPFAIPLPIHDPTHTHTHPKKKKNSIYCEFMPIKLCR